LTGLRSLTNPATLRARIFWYLVPIFVTLFALVGLVNVQVQRRLAEAEFAKLGFEIAASLAYSSELGVIAEDSELLESSIRPLIGNGDVAFVRIFDQGGELLAGDGDSLPSGPLPETRRAELAAGHVPVKGDAVAKQDFIAFFAPILTATVASADEMLLGMKPVGGGGAGDRQEVVGFLQVGLSLAGLRQHTATLLRLWAGLAAGFLILTVFAIDFFARRITKPINLLKDRAEDIAQGHLDQTIPVASRDEIGQLAATFNGMAAALQSNVSAKESLVDELQELNRSLENRIRERTAELEELYRLSAAMQEPLSLREALSRVLDGARELVGIDRLSLWALNPEGDRLMPLSATGIPEEEFARVQNNDIRVKDAGALTTVIEDAVALLYPQGSGEPVILRMEELAGDAGADIPESLFLMMPVLARGSPIGVLACDNRTTGRAIGESTLAMLQTFSAHAASAIENAQLFQELDEKGREIEAANRHKSEFLANMSHELRTPLNAVIGFSEVLLEKMFGELNDKQEEYVGDILDSGRHLLSLINDVLDLSKIEAGQMELSPRTFSLPSALENALTLVKERAQSRGVKLEFDAEDCPETLVADERKFKQILLNLLSNAVKFTEAGGTVRLEAKRTGDMLAFAIVDTGIGISDPDQAAIFDAFRQAEGEYVRKAEGTGLGLTLSRRMVELHGGRIWVESTVGEGSTFTFTLPVRETGEDSSSPALVADATQGSDSESAADSTEEDFVLVIEDDPASANLLAIHLKDSGVRVEVATDGRSGLEIATTRHPKAIVLDLVLPEMDGWEVLAHLRNHPVASRIPVVIVSIVEEQGKGLTLGAADYLVKPYDPGHLVTSVRDLIQAREDDTIPIVLAIDDEPRALELMRAILEPEGFRVLTALSGEEGLALAREEPPDLVVLDLMMPGLDGFEVARTLHDDPSTKDIPIVVLTAGSLGAAERRRLSGRITHLGRKSEFQRADFVSLVRTATKRREQQDGR
jgi:signal transduction histidine kinase/DNA-binding response OmpR family regulator